MKIPEIVYTELATKDRIKTAAMAYLRNDLDELLKLAESCPKKNYKMPDAEYSDNLDKFMLVHMTAKMALHELTLDYIFEEIRSIIQIATGTEEDREGMERIESIKSDLISVQVAWKRALTEADFSWDEINKLTNHPALVNVLIASLEGTEDQDTVEHWLGQFRMALPTC